MTAPILEPSRVPAMYFIGVTTAQSSIMKIFPIWSQILGLNAQLIGYDAPIGGDPAVYRAIVQHIKTDPLTFGGLVTTHKIDLLAATRDLFDDLDPNAQLCDEVSAISKRDGKLEGHALDPVSSGLTVASFVPAGHWDHTHAHVLCLGVGGAAIAISVYLAGQIDRPQKFICVDRVQSRLDSLRRIHSRLKNPITFEYILSDDSLQNDQLMAQLPPGSMVINATGMGKDRPGSPITDSGLFPEQGIVWELNYRGELGFLQQARRQRDRRHLMIEDGWSYFIYGWTQAIAQVFHLSLTPELFTALDKAAATR